jgi:hypothetical protein
MGGMEKMISPLPPLWLLISVVGCIWTYCGLIAIRWDRYGCKIQYDFLPMITFILWWIVIPAYWHSRPPKPWRITDPRPSAAERVRLAEQRSMELERECGLVFDEVILLPGYVGT